MRYHAVIRSIIFIFKLEVEFGKKTTTTTFN